MIEAQKTEELLLNACIMCGVCGENPSTTVKGGALPDGRRGLWFCCSKCMQTISGFRRSDMRGSVGDRRE